MTVRIITTTVEVGIDRDIVRLPTLTRKLGAAGYAAGTEVAIVPIAELERLVHSADPAAVIAEWVTE
jgi:hypothetical protein